jgi:hypothetical protein
MAMSQIAQDSIWGASRTSGEFRSVAAQAMPIIRLGDYLQSEIITHPLPNKLLDRLADLYWTERESELAI